MNERIDGLTHDGVSQLDPVAEDWWLYSGTGQRLDPQVRDARWPDPPRWRSFHGGPDLSDAPADDEETRRRIGDERVRFRVDPHEVSMVNAAIYLRRPLLVTGRPGSGKSSLAHRITRELGLGRVLQWPIASRTDLRSGLYDYDAIGRAQAAGHYRALSAAGEDPPEPDIGEFIHLGPLGTALQPRHRPRVLLIDEFDKSDIDLPNDLLHVFEEGRFLIPELVRVRNRYPRVTVHTADPGVTVEISEGIVHCHEFPIVIITSNSEREFPPAFLRRCLRFDLPDPDEEKLASMVAAHFDADTQEQHRDMIGAFLDHSRRVGGLAADQLLNAVYLATSGAVGIDGQEGMAMLHAIWHKLSSAGPYDR